MFVVCIVYEVVVYLFELCKGVVEVLVRLVMKELFVFKLECVEFVG